MIAFFAAIPFWFGQQFGISMSMLSLMSLPAVVCYIIGSLINNFLLSKFNSEYLLKLTIFLLLLVAILQISVANFFQSNVISISAYVSMIFCIAGFIVPLSNAIPCHKYREHVGLMPGILSGLRCLFAAILVPFITNLNLSTLMPLAIYSLCLAGLILLSLWYFNHEKN